MHSTKKMQINASTEEKSHAAVLGISTSMQEEGALNVQAIQSRVFTVITTGDTNSGCQVMSPSAQFLFLSVCIVKKTSLPVT